MTTLEWLLAGEGVANVLLWTAAAYYRWEFRRAGRPAASWKRDYEWLQAAVAGAKQEDGMATLFEIGEDLLALNRLLEEVGGDVSDPATSQAVDEWFATLMNDDGKKLDGYCNLIKLLEAEAAIAKAEAKEYQAREKARTNRVEYLKERMRKHLLTTGRTEAQTATGRVVAIQKNGGTPELVWTEGEPIPEEYMHTQIVRKPKVDVIREALKNGEELPFVKLGETGSHLRIR